jgi:hypothetical protein
MPSIACLEDLKRVEKLGGVGLEMKNVFDTMSWFNPESQVAYAHSCFLSILVLSMLALKKVCNCFRFEG